MRVSEFLESDNGRMSMTRLIVLLTWPPATYVVLSDHDQLTTYLTAYISGYALGKGADIFMGGKDAVVDDSEVSGSGSDFDSGVDARAQNRRTAMRKRKPQTDGKGL